MNRSRLVAIETVNPPLKLSQKEVLKQLLKKDGISKRALQIYKHFLSDKGIQTRYFGLKDIHQIYDESPDEAILRFQKVALEIGAKAITRCLKKARLSAQAVDGLIVTTCTGYLCPGLTSYLAEKAGFRENIFTLDLAGSGCGAAILALRAADQFLRSGAGTNVLVLSAEVCSAALFWGNEIDLILSNSIFGDGAAACLLSNAASQPGFEPIHFESLLWPQHRDALRFKSREGRLCNVINRKVPDIAAKASRILFDKLLSKSQKDILHYAIHPGGRRILDRIQTKLRLRSKDMIPSRRVLRHYGNMSSPTILFVLKDILETQRLRDGETVALFAFGAGFTALGAMLEYRTQENDGGFCASRL